MADDGGRIGKILTWVGVGAFWGAAIIGLAWWTGLAALVLPGIFAEIVEHPSDAQVRANIDTLRPEYALQRAPYAEAFAGEIAGFMEMWPGVASGERYPRAESDDYIRVKAVAIDVDTRDISYLHAALPPEYRVESPEEVAAIIFVSCHWGPKNWRKFSYPAYGATCELHVVDRAEGAIGKPWPAEVNPDAPLDGVTYAEPWAALAGTIESLRVKYDPERCPEVEAIRPDGSQHPRYAALRECFNQAFAPALDAYLATWPAVADGAQFSHAADDYLRPRAVAVDIKSGELDALHYHLPPALRAGSPAEANSVILVSCEREEVGLYDGCIPAYRTVCEAYVVDRTDGVISYTTTARRDPPDEIVTYEEGSCSYAGNANKPRPTDELAERIEQLPRR